MQGESDCETLKHEVLCQKTSTVGRSGQALAAPVVFSPCLRTTREECGLPRWPSGKESACNSVQETQETQVLSMGQEDPLEEGMATHSSVPAWKTPWTEEPGGLQSTGLQRVGHN